LETKGQEPPLFFIEKTCTDCIELLSGKEKLLKFILLSHRLSIPSFCCTCVSLCLPYIFLYQDLRSSENQIMDFAFLFFSVKITYLFLSSSSRIPHIFCWLVPQKMTDGCVHIQKQTAECLVPSYGFSQQSILHHF